MHTFNVELNLPFDEAVFAVQDALAAEKFGVVADIDVRGILKAKMDVDYPGYRVLGACRPGLAKRVADADPDAGALLPCNVLIREETNGRSVVAFMDPETVLGLSANEEVLQVAREAKQDLLKVVGRLTA